MFKKKARANTSFSEGDAMAIIRKLCNALEYCHKKGIYHGDLKPSDVMFNDKNEPILIDFGWSDLTSTDIRASQYTAPEIKAGKQPTSKSDVWSLGVILSVMLLGRYPFIGEKYTLSEKLRDQISRNAFDLLTNMLTENPKNRYSIEDVLDHPWFKIEVELDDVKENFLDSDEEEGWNLEKPSSQPRRLNSDVKSCRGGSQRRNLELVKLGSFSSIEKSVNEETEDSSHKLGSTHNESPEEEERMQKIMEEILDDENAFKKKDGSHLGFLSSSDPSEIFEKFN